MKIEACITSCIQITASAPCIKESHVSMNGNQIDELWIAERKPEWWRRRCASVWWW